MTPEELLAVIVARWRESLPLDVPRAYFDRFVRRRRAELLRIVGAFALRRRWQSIGRQLARVADEQWIERGQTFEDRFAIDPIALADEASVLAGCEPSGDDLAAVIDGFQKEVQALLGSPTSQPILPRSTSAASPAPGARSSSRSTRSRRASGPPARSSAASWPAGSSTIARLRRPSSVIAPSSGRSPRVSTSACAAATTRPARGTNSSASAGSSIGSATPSQRRSTRPSASAAPFSLRSPCRPRPDGPRDDGPRRRPDDAGAGRLGEGRSPRARPHWPLRFPLISSASSPSCAAEGVPSSAVIRPSASPRRSGTATRGRPASR